MQEKNTCKYRIKLTKKGELRFISHLDWQSLVLKIFRRCKLDLALSEGFNKMPKVSFSPALPIFIESECELVNFQTLTPLKENFIEIFAKNCPQGVKLISLSEINENSKEPKSLENYLQWAHYSAKLKNSKNHIYNLEKIRYIIEKCLSSDELLITKKTKKGIEKTINYRTSLETFTVSDDMELSFVLKVGQNEEIPSLRADDFLKVIFGDSTFFSIKRTNFFDSELKEI